MLDNHEEAIKDYNKAIELKPLDASYYNNRGASYLYLGRYEEALRDFDKALELDPNFTGAIQNKSLTFAKTETEKSREVFEKQLQEITHPEKFIKTYDDAIKDLKNQLDDMISGSTHMAGTLPKIFVCIIIFVALFFFLSMQM